MRETTAFGTRQTLAAAAALLAAAIPAGARQAAAPSSQEAQKPKEQAMQQTPPAAPAANPADVESLDGILRAIYDVISGPAGPRDWNRFRSLFAPNARMGAAGYRPDGTFSAGVGPVDTYVERSGAYFLKEGFFEREIARKVDSFGPITHVFSTYESRHAVADAKPFARGINSIQLYNDGKRWYVLTIFWTSETDKNPLPEQYLK